VVEIQAGRIVRDAETASYREVPSGPVSFTENQA